MEFYGTIYHGMTTILKLLAVSPATDGTFVGYSCFFLAAGYDFLPLPVCCSLFLKEENIPETGQCVW